MLLNADLDDAVADATARYIAANPLSQARHRKARANLPGGNTRSVLWYEPFPVTLIGGEGVYVTDLDGHRYADFVSEYTAGLYGHSNPIIMAALQEVIRNGVALGAPNAYEALLAQV